QYMMMNKNLKISLKVNDLFRTEKENISSTVNGIFQKGAYYYDNQYVRVSITYKFGDKKIKDNERKSGNEEIKERTVI
ncbi:outer membrane beta-barrel protein, partial [Burkholderia sp. SIMBA_048]